MQTGHEMTVQTKPREQVRIIGFADHPCVPHTGVAAPHRVSKPQKATLASKAGKGRSVKSLPEKLMCT